VRPTLIAAASIALVVFTLFVWSLRSRMAAQKIYLAKHYNFVMIKRATAEADSPECFRVDEVDRPQPVVERAAAALLLERNTHGEQSNSPLRPSIRI